MKATELRVGNWILIPYQNAPIAIPAHETQVQGITIFGEILTDNTLEREGLTTHYNHVSGIPLTQEWLLWSGFKPEHGTSLPIFAKDDILISLTDGKVSLIADDPYCAHHVRKLIKYVHELQNLYFDLKDEELEMEQK